MPKASRRHRPPDRPGPRRPRRGQGRHGRVIAHAERISLSLRLMADALRALAENMRALDQAPPDAREQE